MPFASRATGRRPLAALLAALVSLLWGCGADASGDSPSGDPQTLPPGWTVYQGGSGLVILHPEEWTVVERGNGAFAVFHPGVDGGADAVAAVQPMERIDGSALGVATSVGEILPDLFPGATSSWFERVSTLPDVAMADLAYRAGGRDFSGTALCFHESGRGVLYAMASSADAPPDADGTMQRILTRFLYVPAGTEGASRGGEPPGGPGTPTRIPEMVAWTDPMEGAFTVPVPRGWEVEGGMVRYHAVDVRPDVLVTSPDGEVTLRIGDSFTPTFVTPGPMLTSTGFREGSWYSPDGLLRVMVNRYLPGAEFLSSFYLPQRVENAQVTERTDLPELSREALQLFAAAGIAARVHTGEVSFTASAGGGSRKGYALAQTLMVPLMGSPTDGNWFVTAFHGYLAPPEREAEATAVLADMVGGFRMNPQWVARQVQTTGEVSRISYDAQDEMYEIFGEVYANRQASEERIFRQYTELNRGLTVIQDPQSGERFQVPLGSKYWWRLDDAGPLLGTEGAIPPELPGYWVRRMDERTGGM